MTDSTISPNSLSFIALANEYCNAVQNASQSSPEEFVGTMLRLIPRLYITASDLNQSEADDTAYIDDYLDEESYNRLRLDIETLLGENDTYLEVFEEDMKYSDTPIAASIAENLCDIFQVLYNFIETIRDSTPEIISSALFLIRQDFGQYWSRSLCNVLRALNNIKSEHYDQ